MCLYNCLVSGAWEVGEGGVAVLLSVKAYTSCIQITQFSDPTLFVTRNYFNICLNILYFTGSQHLGGRA